MNDKKQIIRDSHNYRFELLEDIKNARIDKFAYHQNKIKVYQTPSNELGILNRIKDDPLRSNKNHTLSMNSMCCLVAEYGGLDSIKSHYLAEKYAILIEEADSQGKLLKIYSEFLYQYLDPDNRPRLDDELPLSQKINLYIRQEFMNDISVYSVAEHFYLSREHISRTYKKESNDTINNQILKVRIDEAKKFLVETRMTITEIALTVGFNSSQYFSKSFKKITGLTPSDYRER